MSRTCQLVIDLGDAFTKGIAVDDRGRRLFRFPSVIARRLATTDAEQAELPLGDDGVFRPDGFDASRHPRGRSYPDGDAFRRGVRAVARSRYVGWPAVAHGVDREMLATHPTDANVDALVHKALLLTAVDADRVDAVFVVGMGATAHAIARHVARGARTDRFLAWTVGRAEPRRVELTLEPRVVDAAACAAAALPAELLGSRAVIVDIGYRRTKLAIWSRRGCEHQDQLAGIGVADCVRRILRDEQERGLIEDEFAVIRALERSRTVIEIAGRRFDVGRTLDDARRAVEEELAGALARALRDDFARCAATCPTAAIIGGGAPLLGDGLAARIRALGLGVDRTWVCPDGRFFLSEGALAAASRVPP